VGLRKRAAGTLTGTRVAGVLGRCVIVGETKQRERHWRPFGFVAGANILTHGTWADNLFTVSNSIDNAIYIQEDIEKYIGQKWL